MFRIRLARLGQTMEQGTIVQWLKREGDTLEIGADLYEVETEKAVVPVQATRAGRLSRIVVPEGSTVRVGAILAIAADPGEQDASTEIERLCQADEGATQEEELAPAATPSSASESGASAARKAAAVPKARALARELDMDLGAVSGTGPDGAILLEDVRRAAATRGNAKPPSGRVRRIPLSAIARSMIRTLERSCQIPQFTQVALVDVSALRQRRSQPGASLTYMDYFLDALVTAARQVPEVLVTIHGDEVWRHAEIDVTIATATDKGLLVPVLRNAGATDIVERSKAWRELADRARSGKLGPDDVSGGTVALSNLGTRGVDSGTPLLPAGHALIAFFGAVADRVVVADGRAEVQPTVYLSITYDHRVIDGVLASRFTTAMAAAIAGTA